VGKKLSALFVAKHRRPGRYADGGVAGLYLQVGKGGARSWLYRYTSGGKAHAVGLGSSAYVSLAEARDAAVELGRLRRQGVDPIQHKIVSTRTISTVTFGECFDAYIAAHSAGWKPRHTSLWRGSVTRHALPVIGNMPVAEIDTAAVLRVLTPIWTTKPETAAKLRARIEAVLDQARVLGHRDGENPARWRGHLDKLLAAPGKVRRVEHRRALPYKDVPKLMTRLRERGTVAASALQFLILTAARTSEILGVRRDEINIADAMWTIPATRMKSGKEHRVPLSGAALEIVSNVKTDSELVFPSIHDRALYDLLRRSNVDATTHGFRSSFRDWAAEQTTFPNHVIEQALAHSIGKVEAAYRRSDLFKKRRELMNAWSRFCSTPAEVSDVIPLRRSK
jgi:integrase